MHTSIVLRANSSALQKSKETVFCFFTYIYIYTVLIQRKGERRRFLPFLHYKEIVFCMDIIKESSVEQAIIEASSKSLLLYISSITLRK